MNRPTKRLSSSKSRGRGTRPGRVKRPKRLSYLSPSVSINEGKENDHKQGSPAMSMAPITFSSRHQPAPPLFNLSFGSDLNDELLDKMDVHHTCSTPMGQHPVNHYRGASIAVSNTSASPLFSFSCSQAKDNSKTQASNTSIPSFMTTPAKDCKGYLKLSKWGIPELVLEQYSRRGISSMYEWQAECLMKPGVLQGGNLVFSAPTSAGKTFIAELLALKCVLETRKKVVIILPFVSIAHEKSNYLRSIFEPNGVKVGGFMGRQSPQGGFAAVDIAICTIEKANSLLNQLLKEDGINSLGTVVVDELHMIGDSHRGYLLELLLTKLLYFCRKNEKCLTFSKQGNSSQEVNCCSSTIQIVGMSATLPNLDVLAGWLGSQLYCTEERPVPLQEMIKIGPTLYNTQMKRIRDLGDPNLPANDEDDILKLCEKTIINGHSVLIFCPTKQWCENLAASIASAPFIHTATPLPTRRYILDGVALNGVVEQLRRTQVGLDNVLKKTIPCGVAFHHAGLTFDEREIVEGAFRQGLVKVLVATSTLSSGVNLPARMVIVRTPFFQRSLLDVLVYKQMVGRAGRKGVDERGESVLICKASEKSKVASLFQSSPKPIQSCLGQKSVRKAQIHDVSSLRRALLEVIVIGTATSHYELETYIKCTLLFAEMSRKQQKSPKPTSSKATPSKDSSAIVNKLIQSTVDYLIANEFIATRTSTQMRASSDGIAVEYYATQLGAACVASCLSPEEALVVFAELRNARRNFVLENELHIIYLVTPVYIQEQWPSIDWYRFLCLLERLPPGIRHVANTVGIQESFLASAIQGRIPERTVSQQERLRIHCRFFTALALHDLVHEVPIVHVAREYGASKGLLQTLQSASSTFAGMVTVFCNQLGWKNLELLLSQFQSRLAFGIERELCDLVAISLLNGFRARALYNAGFHSLSALATANPLAIECCLRNAVPFRSSKANEEELQQRSSTWCAKLRKGMTEFEAAKEIVHEAQKILSEELNIPLETWKLIQLSNQQKPSKFCNSSSTKPIATKTTRNSNLKDGKGIKRLCLREIKQKRLSQVDQFDSHGKGLVTHPNENLNPPNAGEEIFKQKEETDIPVSKVPPNEHKSLKFNSSDVLNVAITRVSTGQTSHSVVIEDSISYSPILSLDASAHSRRSFSHSLLNTPLPLEPFKSSSPPLSPLPSRELGVHEESLRKSPPSSSNHPPAITSSFPSSMNMSVSFSCHTFALIDAACNGSDGKEEVDQVMSNDMSCSLISGTGECSLQEEMILKIAESFNCHNNASDVAKVDGLPPIPFSGSPCFEPTPHGNQPKLQFGTTPHENQISKLQSELTPHENQVPKLQFGTTPYENRVPKLQSEPTPRENQVPKLQATCKSPLASIDFPSQSLKDLSSVCNSQTSLSQSGACIIDVASNPLLFETFLSECQEQNSIAFSIATSSTAGQGSCIGSKIVPPTKAVGIPIPRQNDQVTGLAFCWGDMNVYYVSLCQVSEQRDKTSIPLATRFKGVCNVFQNRSTHLKELTAYSMKKHVKVLAATFKTLPAVTLMDPTVADWMLDPDGKEKTIHKMVLHYLPDQPVLSEGDDYEEMSLSSLASHASDPRMRSSAEVLLASLLMSKTKALLESENLFQSFLKVEMPSLMILAKMELNGIGFSKEECEILKQILQQRLLQLERDAYALAQRTFSLTSPEDVAQVLFLELKLPCPDSKQQKSLGPNRRGRKKVQHLSTAKEVLEKLKLLHPLPGIVLEWRRISSTVTKMVFPLFKDAVHCDTLNSLRVHPTYQIHTATGRVAASDPNLQMVPKEYDIGPNTDIRSMLNSEDLASATAGVLLSESQCLKTACQTDKKDDKVEISSQDYPHPPCSSVCMRSVFTSFPGGVYLAADYSQLELRVLAHMSGDSKLQKFLNSDGDVFKMIAGEWLGIPSSEVSAKDRQSAKQVCYGMIYGIGAKALAEQLGISNDEATKFMNTFKSKYPAVKTFISSTVQSCKESGHIVTLLGRKRFLPAIHSKNIHACSQAERQAVNSTIQGSAADLVKTAMVNIDTALVDVFKHAPPCLTLPEHSHIGEVRGAYLVLQLHDELLYEVCEKDLVQVAGIVKYHMENALQLSVKFPVKIKSGASWGNLQELSI